MTDNMELGATWARGVDRLEEGDVFTWDGRPVAFRSLIQRRWGWPKKAAYAAADLIRDDAHARGEKAVLWVTNPWRRDQQAYVFQRLPVLVEDLCSGLARGASKEALDADHLVYGVELVFDEPISDDGLIREITHVVANRLGASADDVRAVTRYDTGSTVVRMDVRSSAFGVDP